MVKETFDVEFIVSNFPKILKALPVTLIITIISLALGWLIGLGLSVLKVNGGKKLQTVLRVLTDLIRGIPTVVLLYIVYFGLPTLVKSLFGVSINSWSKQTYVILALAISLGATSSEMFRSAYSSIKKSQLEAAHALGYTRIQRFIHVIAPQGLYVILPNLGSAVLSTIQATALVYTLGIFDILGKARQIDTSVAGSMTFEMYFAVALIYWGLAIIIGWIFKGLEHHFGKENRKTVTA